MLRGREGFNLRVPTRWRHHLGSDRLRDAWYLINDNQHAAFNSSLNMLMCNYWHTWHDSTHLDCVRMAFQCLLRISIKAVTGCCCIPSIQFCQIILFPSVLLHICCVYVHSFHSCILPCPNLSPSLFFSSSMQILWRVLVAVKPWPMF